MNLNPLAIEPSILRTIDAPQEVTPSDALPPESSQDVAKALGACRGGRANGRIARLPKPIRDQINHWIRDGVSYPDIIQRLGEHGKDLTPDNISQERGQLHTFAARTAPLLARPSLHPFGSGGFETLGFGGQLSTFNFEPSTTQFRTLHSALHTPRLLVTKS